MQLEKFCATLSLSLLPHFRVQSADAQRDRALCLRDAAVDIATLEKIPAMARRCTQAAVELIGARLARLQLLGPDGSDATYFVHDSQTSDQGSGRPPPRSAPLERALHSVIADCKPLIVPDIASDARFAGYAKLIGSSPPAPPSSADADRSPRTRAGGGSSRSASQMLPSGAAARGGQGPVNLVCVPLLDGEAPGGETAVRGVLQVLKKHKGPFSDTDVQALQKLGAVFSKAVGQALRSEAMQKTQQVELTLSTASDLDSCVAACLHHLRLLTV